MKLAILLICAIPLLSQTTDPDAVTAKVAIDSLAGRLATAQAEKTALVLENKTKDAEIASLKALLAAASDPVIPWLKSWTDTAGDAQPYSLLRQMSTLPITSYYTPGKVILNGADRYTLACISNAGIAEVGPSAKLATR